MGNESDDRETKVKEAVTRLKEDDNKKVRRPWQEVTEDLRTVVLYDHEHAITVLTKEA